ncbi:MAG: DUF1294 domain-containing protein [Planctomycetota bacterium]
MIGIRAKRYDAPGRCRLLPEETMPPLGALIYFVAINVVAFALMGVDKWLSRREGNRIPETTLLIPALLGGSPGTVVAMLAFRHKTRKLSFKVAVLFVVLVNALMVLIYYRLLG